MGWRGVFSLWRKKGAYRRSAGDDFIPYIIIFFCYWGGDREAAEVALTTSIYDKCIIGQMVTYCS
jgi:hypothetical protein